jgi:DNA-binding NarL/FixJ family response regulator
MHMTRIVVFGSMLVKRNSFLQGAEIIRANSAVGLLEMVQQYRPDLVLMHAERGKPGVPTLVSALREFAPHTRVLLIHDGAAKQIAELQEAAA